MQRVAIIGSPGSGKTTFAKQLHDSTALPLIHLDYYHHQQQHNYYTDRQAWIKRVKGLMQAETWIIEGNYYSTIPERFKAADTIILLDLPRWLCLCRVLRRRFYYRNKKRSEMPDDWQEKIDLQFLKYLWHFNKQDKPKIVAAMNKSQAQTILILKSSEALKQYLENPPAPTHY